MNKRDYYEVLGLSKGAGVNDIKKAYRSLAKQYHPDVNKNSDAQKKFVEIQEAYSVLSDVDKKAKYDNYGHGAFENGGGFEGFDFGGSGFGDLEDILSGMFGGGGTRSKSGPRRGRDTKSILPITFMESINGVTKSIKLDVEELCSSCSGSGAFSKGDIKVCSTCKGSGHVITNVRSIFGMAQSKQACPTCHGKGKVNVKVCNVCKGEGYKRKVSTLDLKIPAGIVSGQQIRAANKGERGINGGPNGDLYFEINVSRHRHFVRDGDDIYIKVPVSNVDAVLGTVIDVPTVYKDVELTIPPGIQPNQRLRIKGKGVKNIKSGRYGDQYVEIDIKIPNTLNKEEIELYKRIKEINGKKKDSVFDLFKKAFK